MTPKRKAQLARASKRYEQANPEFRLWWRAKQRAQKNGLDFDIDRKDIIIPKRCPVLNIALVRGVDKVQDCSPTLDRKDTRRGYVKGNIEVMSHKANSMKRDASARELRLFADWISRTYRK